MSDLTDQEIYTICDETDNAELLQMYERAQSALSDRNDQIRWRVYRDLALIRRKIQDRMDKNV